MKTIPVVVHVIYNKPEENISDAQIASQIKTLNEDFGRTNPDKSNTPAAFANVAVDTGIRFCLVKTVRKKTNVTSFTHDNAVKFCSSGGSDSFDVTKYLNIWVCSLGENLLGYGEFPNTQPSNTYGVVINYRAFGNIGTASSPYNKGRTLTHEFAHCLGIYHIFNEEGNSCTKTDYCADIPSQQQPTSGCPSFPHLESCSNAAPGIMFMNYMDYSTDACMNMFTQDQANRMNAVLNVAPYNTLANTGCTALGGSATACSGSGQTQTPAQVLSPLTKFNLRNIIFIIVVVIIALVILKLMKAID